MPQLQPEPSTFVGTDEQTRHYMLAACEMDLGHIDAFVYLHWHKEREIRRDSLTRQQKRMFLNKVLADFLCYKKHEGRLWSLKELVQIDTSHLGKLFEYIKRNILWAAKVWH